MGVISFHLWLLINYWYIATCVRCIFKYLVPWVFHLKATMFNSVFQTLPIHHCLDKQVVPAPNQHRLNAPVFLCLAQSGHSNKQIAIPFGVASGPERDWPPSISVLRSLSEYESWINSMSVSELVRITSIHLSLSYTHSSPIPLSFGSLEAGQGFGQQRPTARVGHPHTRP